MNRLKWSLLLVLVACLALSLAACGGGAEEAAPPEIERTTVSEAEPTEAQAAEPTEAPEPTVAPTDTPEPEPEETDAAEPEPTEMEGLDTSGLSAATDLSSYRSTMRLTVQANQDGQEIEEFVEVTIEYTSDPPAQHITLSGEGLEDPEATESLDMYVIEGTLYMQVEGQWVSLPATDDVVDAEGFITPNDLLEDLCGWKKTGSAEINGVKAQHWSFGKQDMEDCMPPEELFGIGELTDASGDLYVAEEDNYVVQMDIFYEGENLDMELGESDSEANVQRVEIHYEVTDVNEPFTIQVPEEALASSATPEDIPLPEDAEDVNYMFGMITFTSASTLEDVADFYKAEMPENGWSEVSAEEMPGMYLLEYTKQGRTASFIISPDESDKTSVLITVQEGN